jgi:hypothetical protein
MSLQQFETDLPLDVSPLNENGRLIFSRHKDDTIPIRVPPGQVPIIKPDKIDNLPVVTHFHSRVFDLTNEQQRREYEQIRNAILNQWFIVIGKPRFCWHREKGVLKRYVHIEYADRERIFINQDT